MSVVASLAAMQLGGGILKGIGTWNATKMEVRGFESRADALRLDADSVERAGKYNASQQYLEARRLRARQLVQYAKSGVTMEGTPSVVHAQTKSEADRDIGYALDTTARQAGAMRVEAAYNQWMAASTKIGGIFNVLSGGMASGSKAYSTWKQA